MARTKRLTPDQIMAAAKYLKATGQLPELMACLAIENANEVRPLDEPFGEDQLTELAKSFVYEEFFAAPDLLNDIEGQIEVYTSLYFKT